MKTQVKMVNAQPPGPGAPNADWLATPLGTYLVEQEQRFFDAAVVDLFGYNALQIGLPHVDLLRASRMALRDRIAPLAPAGLRADCTALPIAAMYGRLNIRMLHDCFVATASPPAMSAGSPSRRRASTSHRPTLECLTCLPITKDPSPLATARPTPQPDYQHRRDTRPKRAVQPPT
jgi:hypothetical protein